MTQSKKRQHFIDHIINTLELMQQHQLEVGQFAPDSSLDKLSLDEREWAWSAMEVKEFIDEIPGGFIVYYADNDERIIYANHGLLRILQCDTLEQLRQHTGGSFKNLVHPDDLEDVEKSLHQRSETSQRVPNYIEYRIVRQDGATYWVNGFGRFVRRSQGEDVVYAFVGDSANDWNWERFLAEDMEKEDAAIQAKRLFLSQVSHEMRTPLNAIFGFTSLARTDSDNPKVLGEYLDQIDTAGHQLLDMIEGVLNVSSISTTIGTQKECDLCSILQEGYNFLRPQAKEKSIAFSLDCGGVTHRKVFANAKRLIQIFLNLVTNAITYTNAGGTLDVALNEGEHLADERTMFYLEVRDNGIGISEAFLDKMFDPFSREQDSTLSSERGLGLGLTVVKNIVDMIGGTIDVKTKVGQGTAFIVSLPLRLAPDSTEQKDNIRVLLVDDNDLNLEIETELLQRMGLSVDPVSNGRFALEHLEKFGGYDLIILDIEMPGMNGWQVASTIRGFADPALSRIPIVALSANALHSDYYQSMKSGIDVHLTKPMDLNVLAKTIEELTKKRIK